MGVLGRFSPLVQDDNPIDRRRLLACLGAGAAILLGTGTAGAAASKGWCRTDPIVEIDEVLVDIFVSAPPDAPLLVTGPNRIVVKSPLGVNARLVVADVGFGQGVEVSFGTSPILRRTKGGLETEVSVFVPASDSSMPVLVELAPRVVGILSPASAEGTANTWVVCRTHL